MKSRASIIVLTTLLLLSFDKAFAANTIYSGDIVNGEVKNADLGSNAVTSPKIQDGQVLNADLGANSVTTGKILDLTVGTDDLANGAVTAVKLATGAVTSTSIIDGAIQSADLADLSIQGDKIAVGTITIDKLSDPYYTKAEVDALLAGYAADISVMQSQISALQDLLQHFSRTGNEITISGANLSINNGLGSSWSYNGLGNFTVGYNELRNDGQDTRSGSHNIVLGRYNNYYGYTGLVGGERNQIGMSGVVLNGYNNSATSHWATIVTGLNNVASGTYSMIGSGEANSSAGFCTAVATGFGNTARATSSAVSGGWGNVSDGQFSTVGGGRSRGTASGFNWAAGSLLEAE